MYKSMDKSWHSDPGATLKSSHNHDRFRLRWQLLNGPLPPFVPSTNKAMFDCRKCGRPTRPQPGGNGLCGLCVFNTYSSGSYWREKEKD